MDDKRVKPITPPDLVQGDCVYYRHPETDQIHHGTVAAKGEHGFLADADGGGEHRVTWDRYVGHRRRVERRMRIVDEGEDGVVMEDDLGRRIFVARDPTQGMAKAMSSMGHESSIVELLHALSARVDVLERGLS